MRPREPSRNPGRVVPDLYEYINDLLDNFNDNTLYDHDSTFDYDFDGPNTGDPPNPTADNPRVQG